MLKFLLYFYFICLINFSSCEKLIFVALHSRHGARAPLNCDENTIDYLGEKWTNPGELTPTGQRMEYLLGLRNRQRYITGKYNFLSKQFDPHELLVYSTDVNRTMLSITSQLQGLYPMYSGAGFTLNSEQLKLSTPPVNISCEEIDKEIENLNDSALPNAMTVIPIHTISTSERRMNVHDSIGCNDKVNKTRDNNKFTKNIIIDAANNFNEKYSKKLRNYYDKNPEDFKYDFDWIGLFCDTLVSDYSDGRKMEDFFKRTEIDKDELLEDCKRIIYINFRDDFFGDDNKEVILLGESTLIKEILHYMKLKIDEDMKKDSEINVSDYSKPKMVIYSGHDVTLTGEELFMIKFFGLKDDDYIYPIYTTQLAFEVTRDEEKTDNLDYSSYTVTFYINDKQLIVRNFKEFKDTIEKNVWNNQQILAFCEVKSEESDDKKEESEGKTEQSEGSTTAQTWSIIILGCMVLILLIVIIYLALKLNNIKKNNENNIKGNDGLLNNDEN